MLASCGKVVNGGLLLGGALLHYLPVTVLYRREPVKVVTSFYNLMESHFSGENDKLLQGSF